MPPHRPDRDVLTAVVGVGLCGLGLLIVIGLALWWR
jgi:hypothetical protein